MLAGQSLGIREVDDGIWLAGFMHYNLGYFDLKQKTLQPLDNPFGTRLSPMSQVRGVTYVSGLDTQRAGGPRPMMMSTMSTPLPYKSGCDRRV